MKKFIVKDIKYGTLHEWTIVDILNEINRDRSEKWTDYNETDWQEGWNEWCEGDIYTLVEISNSQQQRMYSEEEVIVLLQKYRYDLSSGKTPNIGDTTKF